MLCNLQLSDEDRQVIIEYSEHHDKHEIQDSKSEKAVAMW